MSVALFESIAKNPPSIYMTGRILLMLVGKVDIGLQAFHAGVLLQVAWLLRNFVAKEEVTIVLSRSVQSVKRVFSSGLECVVSLGPLIPYSIAPKCI